MNMSAFAKLLNDNVGLLSLIFTAASAVATVIYALLTRTLVHETQRMREAQTQPALEMVFRSRDEAMTLLDIAVVNIGAGPAYRVRFEFSAEPPGPVAEALIADLRRLNSLRIGINVLLPGQEFSAYWTDIRPSLDANLLTRIFIRTVCESRAGGLKFERQHTLDLSELSGLIRIGTPSLLSIADSLKDIKKDIRSIATGGQRLQVDSHDREDRALEARQHKEWREKQNERAAPRQSEAGGEPDLTLVEISRCPAPTAELSSGTDELEVDPSPADASEARPADFDGSQHDTLSAQGGLPNGNPKLVE